jgi:CubicO group peptidase (beta-lactamase class C family)/D-alanyl-D-alanine dipeptidase
MNTGVRTTMTFRVAAWLLAWSTIPASASLWAQESVPAREPYAAAVAALEPWIEAQCKEKAIPSLSIALIDDQHVVWARGFGYADPKARVPATAETVYRVGSVSKLFTDLAAMQLVEAGRLDLDAPVTRVLSKFHPHDPFGKPITTRQLMTHRAGLVREPPVGHYFDPIEPSLAATVESLNDTTLIYAPESRTKYSNAGIAVVGLEVEQLRSEPFARALQHTVLEPLGMTRTSLDPGPNLKRNLAQGLMWSYDGQTIPTPTFNLGTSSAGNLVSTVNDLGRFVSALFAGGRGQAGVVVKPETLRAMWEPQFAKDGGSRQFGIGFALGELDGHRRVGHGGAVYGFATDVAALPDDKIGAVVIASRDFANGLSERVSNTALQFMLAVKAGKPLPTIETTEPVAPEQARKLAGTYAGPERVIELIETDGRLYLSFPEGGPRFELRKQGESLVVDSVFAFGAKIEIKGDAQLVLRGMTFDRVPDRRPAPIPARWEGLIGEYGWDHDVLYILEKGGRLHALIEWFMLYPLEELGPDTFKFPDSGLYESERLVFRRDASGRATEVDEAGVIFKRRKIDGEGGSTFRITPLRPVAELRAEALASRPPSEVGDFLPADLVEPTSLDGSIQLDIRYASENNFLSSPVYESPRAFLERPAAESLVRAHRKLEPLGYGLLIHDAYRPWYVTKMFWDATSPENHHFVADPSKGSKHNRGAAVDVTLYDRRSGLPAAMVGGYDEFSPRSFPNYPGGTDLQRWHRRLLRTTLESEGFRVYEFEWWHFDAAHWDRYPILNVPFESLAGQPRN